MRRFPWRLQEGSVCAKTSEVVQNDTLLSTQPSFANFLYCHVLPQVSQEHVSCVTLPFLPCAHACMLGSVCFHQLEPFLRCWGRAAAHIHRQTSERCCRHTHKYTHLSPSPNNTEEKDQLLNPETSVTRAPPPQSVPVALSDKIMGKKSIRQINSPLISHPTPSLTASLGAGLSTL